MLEREEHWNTKAAKESRSTKAAKGRENHETPFAFFVYFRVFLF